MKSLISVYFEVKITYGCCFRVIIGSVELALQTCLLYFKLCASGVALILGSYYHYLPILAVKARPFLG